MFDEFMKQLDNCLEFSVRRFHVGTLACLECKIYTYTYIFICTHLKKYYGLVGRVPSLTHVSAARTLIGQQLINLCYSGNSDSLLLVLT